MVFAVAKLGYHVVAVDLPGFGRSQGKVASTMRGAFLAVRVHVRDAP
jgi:alpha-beta hydrolase superfamily lysophospholipase